MTAREYRLGRLAGLREKQHDAAVLHLRGAQAELHATETATLQAAEATRSARNVIRAAAIGGTACDWLLASAEAELCGLTMQQMKSAKSKAQAAVDSAAVVEANARREYKQMEFTLERIRRERNVESARAEQRTLDEAARLLRNSLSGVPLSTVRSNNP